MSQESAPVEVLPLSVFDPRSPNATYVPSKTIIKIDDDSLAEALIFLSSQPHVNATITLGSQLKKHTFGELLFYYLDIQHCNKATSITINIPETNFISLLFIEMFEKLPRDLCALINFKVAMRYEILPRFINLFPLSRGLLLQDYNTELFPGIICETQADLSNSTRTVIFSGITKARAIVDALAAFPVGSEKTLELRDNALHTDYELAYSNLLFLKDNNLFLNHTALRLKDDDLTELTISHTTITSGLIEALRESLITLPKLKRLYFKHLTFKRPEDYRVFIDAIFSRTDLKELSLLSCQLTPVDLTWLSIHLAFNRSLEKLDISFNKLSGIALIEFSQTIQDNEFLTSITLGENTGPHHLQPLAQLPSLQYLLVRNSKLKRSREQLLALEESLVAIRSLSAPTVSTIIVENRHTIVDADEAEMLRNNALKYLETLFNIIDKCVACLKAESPYKLILKPENNTLQNTLAVLCALIAQWPQVIGNAPYKINFDFEKLITGLAGLLNLLPKTQKDANDVKINSWLAEFTRCYFVHSDPDIFAQERSLTLARNAKKRGDFRAPSYLTCCFGKLVNHHANLLQETEKNVHQYLRERYGVQIDTDSEKNRRNAKIEAWYNLLDTISIENGLIEDDRNFFIIQMIRLSFTHHLLEEIRRDYEYTSKTTVLRRMTINPELVVKMFNFNDDNPIQFLDIIRKVLNANHSMIFTNPPYILHLNRLEGLLSSIVNKLLKAATADKKDHLQKEGSAAIAVSEQNPSKMSVLRVVDEIDGPQSNVTVADSIPSSTPITISNTVNTEAPSTTHSVMPISTTLATTNIATTPNVMPITPNIATPTNSISVTTNSAASLSTITINTAKPLSVPVAYNTPDSDGELTPILPISLITHVDRINLPPVFSNNVATQSTAVSNNAATQSSTALNNASLQSSTVLNNAAMQSSAAARAKLPIPTAVPAPEPKVPSSNAAPSLATPSAQSNAVKAPISAAPNSSLYKAAPKTAAAKNASTPLTETNVTKVGKDPADKKSAATLVDAKSTDPKTNRNQENTDDESVKKKEPRIATFAN